MKWNGFKQPVSYCLNGKVKYDKKGAQSARNHRYAEDHVQLRIYHCPICNQWHLTSRV